LADLEAAIRELGVRPSWYSIGTEKDNALCIVLEGRDWKVFFSERGDRYDTVAFHSEEEACASFLNRLKDMRDTT
jgi:transposase InsO family protein